MNFFLTSFLIAWICFWILFAQFANYMPSVCLLNDLECLTLSFTPFKVYNLLVVLVTNYNSCLCKLDTYALLYSADQLVLKKFPTLSCPENMLLLLWLISTN